MVPVVVSCSNGEGPVAPRPGNITLRLEEIVSGLNQPVHLTAPVGDDRLFIVEQVGRILIAESGHVRTTPFLDIRGRVRSGGERGLLSMAFHPDYPSNGLFFVDFTDSDGNTRIERFSVTRDPNVADPGSGMVVLTVDQPFSNHNGGFVSFGSDGMFYIGLGDGGSGGDPLGHGQNTSTLLGSILRIDVDRGLPFTVPQDNPFVGTANARDEIWAYGLRNPWRFAFDHMMGLLYVADVGQNTVEEINVVRDDQGGLNFGWNLMEGSRCFGAASCDVAGLVIPQVEYPNPTEGCSVIGGMVYRGTALPTLAGHYFYSDFCGGWLRSFRYRDGEAVDATEWDVDPLPNVLSFGQDGAGELYVLVGDGRVFKIAAGV